MKKMLRFSFLLLVVGFSAQVNAQIDPALSVQGLLKKSNGVAVDDGIYSITFKLYTAETGGTAIWTETQPTVEVSSGIYSATLGIITPLNVALASLYYLGGYLACGGVPGLNGANNRWCARPVSAVAGENVAV